MFNNKDRATSNKSIEISEFKLSISEILGSLSKEKK